MYFCSLTTDHLTDQVNPYPFNTKVFLFLFWRLSIVSTNYISEHKTPYNLLYNRSYVNGCISFPFQVKPICGFQQQRHRNILTHN